MDTRTFPSALISVTSACLLLFGTVAQAGLLTNEDFETGDLTGWTTFTTANGTLGDGFPRVTSFDTTGSGASLAAHFRVGDTAQPATLEGGGIFQSVVLDAGTYSLSADIATLDSGFSNTEGGIFDLMFDNVVVDTVDLGSLFFGATERDMLASVNVATAGPHEVRIRIQRPKIQSSLTPQQFVDNVLLNRISAPVPEPTTLMLFGLGLAGLAFARPGRCGPPTARTRRQKFCGCGARVTLRLISAECGHRRADRTCSRFQVDGRVPGRRADRALEPEHLGTD